MSWQVHLDLYMSFSPCNCLVAKSEDQPNIVSLSTSIRSLKLAKERVNKILILRGSDTPPPTLITERLLLETLIGICEFVWEEVWQGLIFILYYLQMSHAKTLWDLLSAMFLHTIMYVRLFLFRFFFCGFLFSSFLVFFLCNNVEKFVVYQQTWSFGKHLEGDNERRFMRMNFLRFNNKE